jgi:hypothetical protein
MRCFFSLLLVGILSLPAAAITLDGSTSGDGYSLAALQTVETGFGDNASELNAAWAKFEGGVLNLVFTGNLHDFNKLSVFFDTVAGGQNTIGPDTNNGGTNPPNDNWASELSGIGPGTSGNPGPGFTFDTGFDPDYHFIARRDGGNTQFDVDYAVIGGGALAFQSAGDIFGATAEGSAPNVLPTYGISVAANNSNVAGVLGGSGAAIAAAAMAVQTGVELSIPLSALGNPTVGSSIRISAFINGSNHDYLSNQILSGFVAPQGNPGGDSVGGFTGDASSLNLNTFAGAQYFELRVVPEPTSLVLFGIAFAGLTFRRRR